MSDYNTAWDALTGAIGRAKGMSSGYVDDVEHLTVDQQLKVAEIAALISISQELSALNPSNTTTYDEDGTPRNGWGFPIPRSRGAR